MTIIRDETYIATGLAALIAIDPRLASIAQAAGPVPLRLSPPGFAGLASIIVSQMVSRASADAIWRRIEAAGPVTAQHYSALDPSVVATFGLSRAKAKTLSSLAVAVNEGAIDLDAICTMGGEDAFRLLVALPGVGPWTAEVYLMFCAGHPDIFPSGDVALQAAVGHGLGLAARPSAGQVKVIAEDWAPHRSIAARLFWAHYAQINRREVAPIV